MSFASGAPCLSRALGHAMATPSAKRIAVITFAAALGVVTILVLLVSTRSVRIHEPGFRLISVAASRDTNQTIYFESQLKGRVREHLRRIGLGGQPVKTVNLSLRDKEYISFSVVYAGDLSRQELEAVSAELEDSTGKVTRLDEGFHAPNRKESTYVGTWVLRLPTTNSLNYRLWLRLPEGGRRLAEVRLGKL